MHSITEMLRVIVDCPSVDDDTRIQAAQIKRGLERSEPHPLRFAESFNRIFKKD